MTNYQHYENIHALRGAYNCAIAKPKYHWVDFCDFADAEYAPENLPIPAWLFDKRNHLLGKRSSRLFDINEVTSTPSHIVITVSCHHGSDINTHVETYPDISYIHNIYDVITIEVVPT